MIQKNQKLIFAGTAILLFILVALGTILLLTWLNGRDDTDAGTSNSVNDSSEEEVIPEGYVEQIDEEINNSAEDIENEAKALLETDPAQAQLKFNEAAEMYKEAGNVNKYSEAQANAMTAGIIAEEQVNSGATQ